MGFKIFIFYSLLVFTVVTFASGVLFYRVSVKYIDKHMEKDGVSPPGWDKGIGASVSFYIFAMFFERSRIPTPMFDGRFVAKYTRTLDKIIGAIHLVSIIGAVLSLCIITFLKHS
ncbi:hypothetical protein BIZ38_04310 [Pseudoalteromonas sp. BZK2]|uniref:hypothetical protein n=1 Tax=unclassified Pseudoalteromonas TaxID=194690 RepID=UPI00110B1936|nr:MULTISPECIES: hypothetical protein [unclassified Pseudoalteromonas]MBC7007675.1 hypothetical protein [Pseudoalteromonas sp. BZK2]TMP16184.1 hypothetical protein CWC02_14525 [Pseudoalteromonas sp. S2721]